MRFPSLSKPQALGLVLWHGHCPLMQLNRWADVLAIELG
jgi:hypothetical protein